jgi:hypothetical protein
MPFSIGQGIGLATFGPQVAQAGLPLIRSPVTDQEVGPT